MSKRTRTKKRRTHHRRSRPRSARADREAEAIRHLAGAVQAMQVPPVETFPGCCDASLDRPDMIKFLYASGVQEREPGRSKLKQLEADYARGKLRFLPQIKHFAMEKFFWHGLPGDSWHPLDAFLSEQQGRFSGDACRQLRQWKEAELNIFEIGEVHDDTIGLRVWDVRRDRPVGPWFRAIDLSIGGVNIYRECTGQLTLTWLAPWAPGDDVFCAMGYGSIAPKSNAAGMLLMRYADDAEFACSVWPWHTHLRALREYDAKWQRREWQSWFEGRVELPLDAVVMSPNGWQFHRIEEILSATADQAKMMGIYFAVECEGEVMIAGATSIMPLDLTTPTAAAFFEYAAYREKSGPPPGVRNQPTFQRIR